MSPPEIFDRTARRLRRDRISGGEPGYFIEHMIGELLERLDSVSRSFAQALVVGAEPALIAALRSRGCTCIASDASIRRATLAGGIQADEDRLPFADASFDLVVSVGCLDTVADLPGALTLARRALRPDGLFLANFAAAPSLPSLRLAVTAADGDRAIARIHPQIDVRAAGDLLVRAGFALPVADLDTFTLTYPGIDRLFGDLRAAAATNLLADRQRASRGWLARAAAAFDALAGEDGRTRETVSLVTLTGWAPASSQPKPAQRGSGQTSLAAVIGKRR